MDTTIAVYMQTVTSSWTENAHLRTSGVKSELARVPSKYYLMNLAVMTVRPKSKFTRGPIETSKRGPLRDFQTLGMSPVRSFKPVVVPPNPYLYRNEMLSHPWSDHTSTMLFNLAEDGETRT